MLHPPPPQHTLTHTHTPGSDVPVSRVPDNFMLQKSNARPLKPFVKTMYKIIHELDKLYV